MGDIRDWLHERGFGEFAEALESGRVELEALPGLTDVDLKQLGLPLGAHRNVLSFPAGTEFCE